MSTNDRPSVTPSQFNAPTLAEDYFRQKVAEGLAKADRGESRPWDVESMKADLIRRLGEPTNAG